MMRFSNSPRVKDASPSLRFKFILSVSGSPDMLPSSVALNPSLFPDTLSPLRLKSLTVPSRPPSSVTSRSIPERDPAKKARLSIFSPLGSISACRLTLFTKSEKDLEFS